MSSADRPNAPMRGWESPEDGSGAEHTEREDAAPSERGARLGFHTLFRHAGIGIALVGVDGRLLRANPALAAMLGYTPSELRGRHFDEITFADDIERDRNMFEALLRGERARYRLEKRYVRRDGHVIWGRLTATLVRDDAAEPRYGIGMLEDITDEQEAEAALRESEELARRQLAEIEAIYRNAPVGMCVLDPELRFVRINDRLAAINGLPAEQHIGHTVRQVVPSLADAAEPRMRGVLESGEPSLEVELSGETPAQPGETRYWLESYFPIRDGEEIIGLNVVVEEITERKRTEAELRRAKNAAEVANRAKTDFLAIVSHELRTPLTAVLGYADLLDAEAAGELTDAQRRYLHRIEAGAQHLREIIDQILHAAALETGTEEVTSGEIDLSEVTGALARAFAPQAEQKGLGFHVQAPDRPVRVRTDSAKLRLILFNLLSNAIKFTRDGDVELILDPDGHDGIEIRVRDTGPGIPADAEERVFERFAQSEGPWTREHGGLGLGLAMSRRLSELLGGEIDVESKVGVGSTFTLRLPLHESANGRGDR